MTGRRVLIGLDNEDRIAEVEAWADGAAHSPDYRRCFGGLPQGCGALLTPQ
jgi:hypothetical protein